MHRPLETNIIYLIKGLIGDLQLSNVPVEIILSLYCESVMIVTAYRPT